MGKGGWRGRRRGRGERGGGRGEVDEWRRQFFAQGEGSYMVREK